MGTGLGTWSEWRGRWRRGIEHGISWIWPTRSLLFDFAVYISWHTVD